MSSYIPHEYVAKGPDLFKRTHYPEGDQDSWLCKYESDEAAKEAAIAWNERRDNYFESLTQTNQQ